MPRPRTKPLADTANQKHPPAKTTMVRNPRGSIPVWVPEDDDLLAIQELASRGLNLERISAALGMGAKFLSIRKAEGDIVAVAIQDAYDRGKAEGEKLIASSLFTKAQAGDTASQIFYLKARCGWRENQDLNVFLSTRTKEERDAIVAAAGDE